LQAEALKDIEDNPKHATFLNRLLEDTERLENQVQKSLELARIEGGGTLNLEPLPLKTFLQNRVFPYYSMNTQKLSLTVDLDDTVISAEPAAIAIIFRNLLDNAIKYTKSLPAEVKIHSTLNHGSFMVNVVHENSVTQADEKELGKLFYRGQNSQGAGVGLYLIKTLMSKMSGQANFKLLVVQQHTKFITELYFKTDAEVKDVD
jgi:two-component system OmpR family sensor kinase